MQYESSSFASLLSSLSSGAPRPTRRAFLGATAVAFESLSAWSLPSAVRLPPAPARTDPTKVVVVGFGGGARFVDTFGDPEHRLIPNLWNRLRSRGVYYSQVWGAGALDHSVGYKNLLSGRWSDGQSDVVMQPSVFEYYRRSSGASARSCWLQTWGSDVANHSLGYSMHPGYGPAYGALAAHPKSLMAWWHEAGKRGSRSVEEPDVPRIGYSRRAFAYAPADVEVRDDLYDLIRDHEVLQSTGGTPGVDTTEWEQRANLVYARHVLRHYQPDMFFLGLCSMDVAHSSDFETYQRGIADADAAVGEIFEILETEPAYSGRTVLIVTPDIGRDASNEPGGAGSYQQHTGMTPESNHRNGLIAVGPGFTPGERHDGRVEQIDVVPTLAALVGFEAADARGHVLPGVV